MIKIEPFIEENLNDDFKYHSFNEKLKNKKNRIKNILLINPIQIEINKIDIQIALNGRYYIYPPYGIGILNKIINNDYKTQIIDLNYLVFEYIFSNKNIKHSDIYHYVDNYLNDTLTQFKPDIVGVSCTFTMNHPSMAQIFKCVNLFDNKIITIAGGVHVTNATELVLKDIPEIDLILSNEAEDSFPLLLSFLDKRTNNELVKEKLKQVSFTYGNKLITINNKINPTGDKINIIPDYGDLKIQNYSKFGELGTFKYWRDAKINATSILSNKGCRARCSFCSVPNFNGKGVRSKTVDKVLEEIKINKYEYDINHFTWLDDDLLYDSKRSFDLFNQIVKQNLNITWDASNGLIASAVVTNPEVIHAAAESGCIGAYFGIESGSEKILKKIHKPSGIKHYRLLGPMMNKYPKIFTRGFLIIGFPNETLGEILETIELSVDIGLDWYTVQLLTPLPSTEIYNEMVSINRASNDSLNLEGEGFTMFSVRESEKQRKLELKYNRSLNDFTNLLKQNPSHIPTKAELDDLWFWADYSINYKPILIQNNHSKLLKLEAFLYDISNRMTRDNALSNYYLSIVKTKLGKNEEAVKYLELSRNYLKKSKYWHDRFKILEINIF